MPDRIDLFFVSLFLFFFSQSTEKRETEKRGRESDGGGVQDRVCVRLHPREREREKTRGKKRNPWSHQKRLLIGS